MSVCNFVCSKHIWWKISLRACGRRSCADEPTTFKILAFSCCCVTSFLARFCILCVVSIDPSEQVLSDFVRVNSYLGAVEHSHL